LRKLKEEKKHTLIVAEHNVEQLAPLADEMILMSAGQIVRHESTLEFFTNPLYLREQGILPPECTEYAQWLNHEGYLPIETKLPLEFEEAVKFIRPLFEKRGVK